MDPNLALGLLVSSAAAGAGMHRLQLRDALRSGVAGSSAGVCDGLD